MALRCRHATADRLAADPRLKMSVAVDRWNPGRLRSNTQGMFSLQVLGALAQLERPPPVGGVSGDRLPLPRLLSWKQRDFASLAELSKLTTPSPSVRGSSLDGDLEILEMCGAATTGAPGPVSTPSFPGIPRPRCFPRTRSDLPNRASRSPSRHCRSAGVS